MPDQELTPLGQLLEHAREEVLHLSKRQAALRAGISGTRWKQIVTGVAWRGREPTPVKSTARTIVAMALAVDVDPAEALRVTGMEVSAEGVAAMVREAREPRPVATAQPPAALGLAEEVERIRSLPLEPDDKIRIVTALLDLYREKVERDQERDGSDSTRLAN